MVRNKLGYLCKVLILCDFLDLGCLRMFVNGRRGNHKSQAFDFRIGCKLNDGTFQFCFLRNENIGVFTINWHFSKWCVSKVPQYTYRVFACSIKC